MTPEDPLPTGWAWTTLGEITVNLDGQRVPVRAADREKRAGQYPYYGASGIIDTIDDYLFDGDYLLIAEDGANLLSRSTPIAFRASGQFWVNNHAHVVQLREKIPLNFLEHYLNSINLQFYVTGTAQPKLNQVNLNKIRCPLPPLPEQQRIVEKVEELLSDLDAGVAALERARANLKKYRAAVLKAAVTGELTADWRAAHPNAEPATELLDCILTQRRRKWETDQQVKFAASGKSPPKGWKEKYPEPVSLEVGLPELPPSWCWATMDTLAELAGGITKGQKRKPEDRIREVPYLRVANVQRGFLDLSEIKTIETTEEEIAELRLCDGDILFNEGGDRDKLGRGWVWRGEVEECIHQNHVFRARLFSDLVNPEFVSHHGNTFGQEWFSRAGKQSVNLASINLSVLRRFPVPVPPADEQNAIISKVQETLSDVDATANYIEASLKRAARLRQSILKEAFAGRLVPQDPTEEPASAVLARIRSRSSDLPEPARRKPSRRPVRRREPKGIIFRRGAIASYIVKRLSANPSFGRTQLVKTLHLVQTHVRVDLSLQFKRHRLGPLDEAIYKMEGFARMQGWFASKDREAKGVTYQPGTNIEDRCQAAVAILGDKQEEMDRLLTDLLPLDTDAVELFSTVYAAWNDLLIDGRTTDNAAIVAEVYAWNESKKRFTRGDILARIAWMRESGYIPTGNGPRTQALPDTDEGGAS